MNNNQQSQNQQSKGFTKGQPQTPRSPEKSASTHDQFKPEHPTVASKNKMAQKEGLTVEAGKSGTDTTDCGSGCSSGKMN